MRAAIRSLYKHRAGKLFLMKSQLESLTKSFGEKYESPASVNEIDGFIQRSQILFSRVCMYAIGCAGPAQVRVCACVCMCLYSIVG